MARSRSGKLPFNVMVIANAVEGMGEQYDKLMAPSKRWREKKELIEQARISAWGEEHGTWPHRMGLTPGCTHYVIIDGVTKGKLDASPTLNFKNTFVQAS